MQYSFQVKNDRKYTQLKTIDKSWEMPTYTVCGKGIQIIQNHSQCPVCILLCGAWLWHGVLRMIVLFVLMLIIFLSGLCVPKLYPFTSQYCLSSMQHYAVCLWLWPFSSMKFLCPWGWFKKKKKNLWLCCLVFSGAQLVLALHGFYWGFNVFVKRGVLFFPAKMSRKLSLPTELKPDLGKPWLCVHATQLLNVESISTLSESEGSTRSLSLNISCQLAKD